MAFIDLKFRSDALGMQTSVYVLIPEKREGGATVKTLYLLHGLSDDNTIWLRRTSVERYAEKYGIAVVMPFGERSFYTDMKYGMDFYTYTAKELPGVMHSLFGLSQNREDNFVAGLSMGGYGALKIGLREKGRFAAAAGLSAACEITSRENRSYFPAVFGDGDVDPKDDLFALATERANDPDKLRIFLGVGTEDFLYGENQKFKAHLKSLGYDLTYRESAGTHNWDFWDEYIKYVLEWMFTEGDKK